MGKQTQKPGVRTGEESWTEPPQVQLRQDAVASGRSAIHWAQDDTRSEAKMATIQEMAEPKTPQEVSRFLGMVNYLAKFLPNLSQVTEPLQKLTQKEQVRQRRCNIPNRKEHAVQ